MQRRQLGSSGIHVSNLCLGTMTFGKEADEETSEALINNYLEAGGNFIDCADVYSQGVSEEIVGRVLTKSGRRNQLVIASKGGARMGPDVNDQGTSRRHLSRALDASLRRLQTDWLDLYQIHWPDANVNAEETLRFLDYAINSGKVASIGVSNYPTSEVRELLELSKQLGLARVCSYQPEYSLLQRDIEIELVPMAIDEKMALLPYSPLGGGVLTGKYRTGSDPAAATRMGAKSGPIQTLDERNSRIAAAVGSVAEKLGRSSAQVALNWVLHRPGVTSPIIGARNVEQLEDNLGAGGWKLDDELAAELDELSFPALPYPHNFLDRIGARSYRN